MKFFSGAGAVAVVLIILSVVLFMVYAVADIVFNAQHPSLWAIAALCIMIVGGISAAILM